MSSRNRIFSIIVIAFVFLAVGLAAYLIFRQPATPPRSLLLYTSYQSPEMITNWIVDTNTGEKWEVGKGLAAWHWSPSGAYLMFYTLSPLPRQIWVSNSDGSELRQVLDGEDYSDLEIKDFDWLSDKTIIVNVVNIQDNHAYVYLLDISTLTFEEQNPGRFMKVSPNGNFWIQWMNQYELADLSRKTTPLPTYLSDYYPAPTENKIAYSCEGKYKYSSLCVADVNTLKITSEHKIAQDAFLNAYGEAQWSQNGEYFGFLYSPDEKGSWFRAIDTSNGSVAYELAYPSKTTRIFWSPLGDKIIDFDGLLLDLKTGQVSDFFAEIGEITPSYIVDWRMIEVP